MQRFPWKRNHKCEHPSRLIFYCVRSLCQPCDYKPGYGEHKFALGYASFWTYGKAAWQRRHTLKFDCPSEFWSDAYAFLRSRKPTWAYTYNAGFSFTLLHGWNQLDCDILRIFEPNKTVAINTDDNNKTKVPWRGKTALDGIPFILETRHNRGPIKFVDTLNYWNESLGDIGQAVGLPKINPVLLDFCDDRSYDSVVRDTEICEKAILSLMDLWEREDLGNWQPTIASLAFSSFRHGKETSQIVAHGDMKADDNTERSLQEIMGYPAMDAFDITECERRSYYGGRTAVYFLGDIVTQAIPGKDSQCNLFSGGRREITGPITVLDVNSLFPFVMQEYPHPIELIEGIKDPQFSKAQRLIEEFWCCADCEIRTDERIYPRRTGQFTVYARGHFATSLCGPELYQAVQTGDCRCVQNLCVYHTGRPFNSFVRNWYSKRIDYLQNGRPLQARFCKLIMNSLYGKLAQKTPLWQTCGHVTPPCRWGGFISQPSPGEPPCIMRAIAGVSQYQSAPRSCRHTFVAAAASITSWARIYMEELIAKCPYNSVVYMDTDSLFCLATATDALKNAGLLDQIALGKLKEIGSYNSVRIWGMKDYELDGIRTIAGLKSDATEVSTRLWEQVNCEGVKQIIQHDPDASILENIVRFHPSSQLNGHVVQWDGWTKPVEIE